MAGASPVRGGLHAEAVARAGLTRARRGQSEARNGTFPPGVSCQLVREHGTAAKGAAAL